MTLIAGGDVRSLPFGHVTALDVLPLDIAESTLRWMETDAPWRLRIADFYEQWEIHVEATILPDALKTLVAPEFIRRLADTLLTPLADTGLELAEVTAHKLLAGQTIKLHNDYIDGAESHRILLQLNRGWQDAQGGHLMLFGSAAADDVERIVRPIHRSGFGFAISPKSFHAVSTIKSGERFTLVYSFKAVPPLGD